MKTVFKLTGMKELQDTIRNLPKAVNRKASLNALRIAGEPTAKMARSLAPVADEPHWIGEGENRRQIDPGSMRESISVSTKLARSQQGDKGRFAQVEMYVGPGQHPQAITQEFGTFNQPAQPFLRPAWEATKLHALDLAGGALWVEIEKAAAKEAAKVKK